MSEKKYDNHKCFVLSAVGYEEITYAELCRRCKEDKSYESRQFIPLHGMLLEVSTKQYKEFYKEQRRQKYLIEQSAENRDVSIDALIIWHFSAGSEQKAAEGFRKIKESYGRISMSL